MVVPSSLCEGFGAYRGDGVGVTLLWCIPCGGVASYPGDDSGVGGGVSFASLKGNDSGVRRVEFPQVNPEPFDVHETTVPFGVSVPERETWLLVEEHTVSLDLVEEFFHAEQFQLVDGSTDLFQHFADTGTCPYAA